MRLKEEYRGSMIATPGVPEFELRSSSALRARNPRSASDYRLATELL